MGKRHLPALFALAVALAGAGAGTGPDAPLRVGTSADYAPFSLLAPAQADGLDGFDVTLLRAYAAERGRRVEWVRTTWPTLVADLSAGRFDLAASGVSVRPDRSLIGRFSVPLAESGAVALVREPTDAQSVEDLDRRQLRIAVNAGGHLERVARDRFSHATLVIVPANDAVLGALLDYKVDAIVTDTLEAPAWEALAGDVKRIGPFTRDRKALLVRSERGELAADLDRWLIAREADGSLRTLRRRWLPGNPQPDTAAPLAALVAAVDERLSLMPWVLAAKRRDVLPIADPRREAEVIDAGVRAVAKAAEESPQAAPPEAAVRAFYRAQIEAAKQVQLAVGRDEAFEAAEPIPDLAGQLRPALIRIGERVAALLVALPGDLREPAIEAACRDGLRSTWLDEASRREIVRSIALVSAAPRSADPEPPQRTSTRASQPAISGSAMQTP